MKRILSLIAVGVLMGLVAACASGNAPGFVLGGSASTYGIGGSYVPGGAATASIGATQGDFVYQPIVTKNADGSTSPIIVPSGCGRQDVPSTFGSLTGNAAAGAGTGGPSLSLNVGRAVATGEPARLLQLAAMQAAAGAKFDVMADYDDYTRCPSGSSAAAPAH